jgi:hypothetical protein
MVMVISFNQEIDFIPRLYDSEITAIRPEPAFRVIALPNAEISGPEFLNIRLTPYNSAGEDNRVSMVLTQTPRLRPFKKTLIRFETPCDDTVRHRKLFPRGSKSPLSEAVVCILNRSDRFV